MYVYLYYTWEWIPLTKENIINKWGNDCYTVRVQNCEINISQWILPRVNDQSYTVHVRVHIDDAF